MADIIKKGLLTAIGTASIAAEKADKILKEVVKKGIISTKDAKILVGKLAKEAEASSKRLQKIISEEITKQANKTKPMVNKGKKTAKKAFSKATKKISSAQKTAEKRGKGIVKKAAKKLRK
ncbi:MAG: hypothetical protein KKC75_07635 [Nanoarchaeota archaeon]|nr:hypothetical protein [Nanoarchaeota archaeon]MBU1004302.1 hypothetical protein [Nanoarchaeota archaeon]MBU1945480.1 hypothetical protein [Nanoarchaeota archaeon]